MCNKNIFKKKTNLKIKEKFQLVNSMRKYFFNNNNY